MESEFDTEWHEKVERQRNKRQRDEAVRILKNKVKGMRGENQSRTEQDLGRERLKWKVKDNQTCSWFFRV